MNKKGLDYAALLTVIVLISVITLYFVLQENLSAQKEIGTFQQPILQLAYDAENLETYLQRSTPTAYEQALRTVLSDPGKYASGCQPTAACPQLNNPEHPTTISCIPDIPTVVSKELNNKFKDYLAVYNNLEGLSITTTYEFAFLPGKIVAVALTPVELPVRTAQKTPLYLPGKATFTPSFSVPLEHELEKFPNIFATLERLAKNCAITPEGTTAAECAKQIAPDWKIEQKDDDARFTIPIRDTTVCYSLVFPEITQPTT